MTFKQIITIVRSARAVASKSSIIDHMTSSLRRLLTLVARLASNTVFVHPPSCCHTINPFPLTVKSFFSSHPKALRPKTRRSPRHRWLTPQVHATSIIPLIIPCCTRRAGPVAKPGPHVCWEGLIVLILHMGSVKFSFCSSLVFLSS